jgi:phospholipid/cholesterol/gamma-HCH transport system substrate-binding protein
MQPSRLAGVGAFVLGGLLLFAVGLFLIGERRMLFAQKFTVYTEFARVSGLQVGAPVTVSGMSAGEVREVIVPPHPGAKFRVRFEVREDLHPLVRTDSTATIQTEGLVGGTFLSVAAGSGEAPQLPDEGTIPGREPFDVADLLTQMSEAVKTVNETILVLRGEVEHAIANVSETVEHADELITTVGEDVEAISESGRRIVADTQQIVTGLREGKGTVGRLLTDDELYERATAIAREAQGVVEQARRAVEQARLAVEDGRQALADFRSEESPARGLAADLRETLGHARTALSNLEENTEALKRNFFFRGYFKQRGYYDLDDITPADYRKGALESRERQPLRIWLRGAVVFETDAEGREVLSESGRVRIDSAMATFLRYPLDAPFVVEGYSAEGSRDERYLQSRARAGIVRDYLIMRFHLDSNRTGVMPLGEEAPGSPDGSTWDGVALTLFVDPAEVQPRPPGGDETGTR